MNFKRQKFLGFLFLIVVFCLFSTSIATEERDTEELQKSKKIKAPYPTSSTSYRGVVAIDASGGCADELYCDFGSDGLWVYAGGWIKLSATDPDWIIGFEHGGTEYLLCDFGSAGLWYWYFTGPSFQGQFAKISSADPGMGFAVDDDNDGDDEVYITFGANGLWRYDKGNATILTKVHATNPSPDSLRSDLWAFGVEEAALDFSADGLWTAYNGFWTKISASSPDFDNVSADVDTSSTAEELIIDFAYTGLWLFDGASWHKLNSSNTLDVIAAYLPSGADYELLCSFTGTAGLWMWDYSGYPGTWTLLSGDTPHYDGGFCEPFDPNDDGWEEVAVDFGTNGLWLYDHAAATKWIKINTFNPEFMIRCDYYCEGNDTALAVDLGIGGLWIYNGKTNNWGQITTASPDGVN